MDIYWLLAILKSNPTVNFADIIILVRAKGNALRDKHKNKDWSIFYFSWTNKRFREYCKNKNHVECKDCICRCHIPGTMDNLAKNIR